jgi:DNA repair protein RecO (recombination protein O)
MATLTTDAMVLHSFDYLETSRILRLATREGGVRSVLARGARRSSRRFSAALDLFAEGVAEIHTRPGRDLDTLAGFDVRRTHSQLGEDLGRFLGASAIAELTLRFAQSADAMIFDAVIDAVSAIAASSSDGARVATLAGAWRLVAELGFAPAVESCADCHESLAPDEPATFSHPAGGTICRRCARLAVAGRILPADARDALLRWTRGDFAIVDDAAAIRAHQRLLREFLREHLADERPMRALDAWMRDDLTPLFTAAGTR